MSIYSDTEMAKNILNYLEGRGYVKTLVIMAAIGMEDKMSNRQKIRSVLDRLHASKIIFRLGKTKFQWMLRNKNWDRDAPFYPVDDRYEDDDVQPEDVEDRPECNFDISYDDVKRETDHSINHTTNKDKDKEPSKADSAEITALKKRVEVLEAVEKANVSSIAKLIGEVNRLEKEINSTRTVEVKQPGKKPVKIDGTVPAVFDRVLALAGQRRNILLIGPAGCGKTTIGELVAKALGLEFGAIPCTSGMSETQLIGKEVHNLTAGKTKYQMADFVERFEQGGVFLLDELDAADPNVLLVLNSALSNGYVNLPARNGNTRAKRHKDFICIGTANTVGRGANRTYAGRSQLDEATLDRFRIGTVECDYDRNVEKAICPDDEILNHCWKIRENIERASIKRVMSTRFIADAYVMKTEADWTLDEIMQGFFIGWSEEEKRRASQGY